MRQTIELLRKQSINVGLTSAHMQSMGVQVNGRATPNSPNKTLQQPQVHQQKQGSEITQFNGNHRGEIHNGNGPNMQRHLSTDSMCSINSISSGCSSQDKAKKKKGWVIRNQKIFQGSLIKLDLFSYSCDLHLPKPFLEMQKSPKLADILVIHPIWT